MVDPPGRIPVDPSAHSDTVKLSLIFTKGANLRVDAASQQVRAAEAARDQARTWAAAPEQAARAAQQETAACRGLPGTARASLSMNIQAHRLLASGSGAPVERPGCGADFNIPSDFPELLFQGNRLVGDFHQPVGRSVF